MASLIFTLSDKDTFLRRSNAGIKLLALLCFSILLSTASLKMLILIASLLLLVVFTHHIQLLKQLLSNWFLLFLALFIFISDYFAYNDLLVSSISAFKFLALITLSIVFTSQTSPDETSRSLGSFLSKLIGKFGYKIASCVELTLALLPIIFNTATTLLEARRSRGENFLRHPIKAISSYSIALINTLLEKVSSYADALQARCYDPYTKRGHKKLCFNDFLLILVIIGVAGYYFYDKTRL